MSPFKDAPTLILKWTPGLLLFLFVIAIDTQTQLSVKLLSRPADQAPLCALDTPSRTVTPQTMLRLDGLGGLGGMPAMVMCAYECISAGDCRQFNTVEDPGTATSCQLYNYLPVNFQPKTNCLHYMTPDVDECALNTDACDPNASCTNTIGSYVCTCHVGYTGSGIHCSDVDECLEPNNCVVPNTVCKNTVGSYHCECSPRHFGNETYCTDTFELYTKSGEAVNLLVMSSTSFILQHSSDTAATQFKLVPCLIRDNHFSCVSMTPVNNPGWYVRHRELWLYVETDDGFPWFPNDASFMLEKNTFDADHSAFRSIFDLSNYYISSVSGSSQLKIVQSGGVSGNEDLASFTIVII